jgi:hypothetical protein
MVLLVYHFDKNDLIDESFSNQAIRLDLGFYPKANSRLKLKSVGFNVNTEGGTVYIAFPDLLDYYWSEETIDETNAWEMPGIQFSTFQGIKRSPEGFARFSNSSNQIDMDLDLGVMDTQKDYFTVVVNGQRAETEVTDPSLNALNNISVVIEMVENSVAT